MYTHRAVNGETDRLCERNRAVYRIDATRVGDFTRRHLGDYTSTCYARQT